MQTRDVRGQKMPKNANVICERPLIKHDLDPISNVNYRRKIGPVSKIQITLYTHWANFSVIVYIAVRIYVMFDYMNQNIGFYP